MADVSTIMKPSHSAVYLTICLNLSFIQLTYVKLPRKQNFTLLNLPIKAPTKPPTRVAPKTEVLENARTNILALFSILGVIRTLMTAGKPCYQR